MLITQFNLWKNHNDDFSCIDFRHIPQVSKTKNSYIAVSPSNQQPNHPPSNPNCDGRDIIHCVIVRAWVPIEIFWNIETKMDPQKRPHKLAKDNYKLKNYEKHMNFPHDLILFVQFGAFCYTVLLSQWWFTNHQTRLWGARLLAHRLRATEHTSCSCTLWFGWFGWLFGFEKDHLLSSTLMFEWKVPFFFKVGSTDIFKWSIFHCYVSLPECTWNILQLLVLVLVKESKTSIEHNVWQRILWNPKMCKLFVKKHGRRR